MIPRFIDASRDPELKGATRQVYGYFVCELSPYEWRAAKRSDVARTLELSERAVDGAISWLVRSQYIEAGKRVVGSPQVYRLVYSLPPGTAVWRSQRAIERARRAPLRAKRLLAATLSGVRRRRAQRRAAPGNGISGEQWTQIVDDSLGLCAYCNERADPTLDHIDPLSRGGAHEPENAVVACRRCNISKNATPLALWLAKRAARRATQRVA